MHVNLLHVFFLYYYIHWYKYAQSYVNFVDLESMLDVFKSINHNKIHTPVTTNRESQLLSSP